MGKGRQLGQVQLFKQQPLENKRTLY